MVIDFLILFISQYGIYLLVLLILLKFSVLLRYKASNPGYAVKNILSYFGTNIYYQIRDKDITKFKIMKRYNNILAIAIYPLLVLYILSVIIINTLSHK